MYVYAFGYGYEQVSVKLPLGAHVDDRPNTNGGKYLMYLMVCTYALQLKHVNDKSNDEGILGHSYPIWQLLQRMKYRRRNSMNRQLSLSQTWLHLHPKRIFGYNLICLIQEVHIDTSTCRHINTPTVCVSVSLH